MSKQVGHGEEGLEMDPVPKKKNGVDVHTRFQVNKVHQNGSPEKVVQTAVVVSSESEEDGEDVDVHSVTDRTRLNSESDVKYSKSLR